ncbi:TetR/AcrR family transcriptional regulator [Amycolatopsis sp. lyj-112]|uniref:TetR/AcrR family transcriptional regulator n=1 Tax=Amycolatopsis sp. lyj-112 TaxID=2789288 RepID=UPI003979212C
MTSEQRRIQPRKQPRQVRAELLIRHLDGDRATATLRRHEDLPESLEDIMRVFVRTVIENHLDDPELLRIMIEHAPRSGELLEKVTRQEWELIGDLRDLFGRHPEVRVQDKDTAARLVTSTVEMTVHQLIAAPGSIDTTRLENELVAMITGYLRTDTASE